MNKIKQELRQKMLGQLSDCNTQLDVDNAYDVVKKSVLSFSLFLSENYHSDTETWSFNKLPLEYYQDKKTYDIIHISEIYKIWENGLD